jgi:hypothetical protein
VSVHPKREIEPHLKTAIEKGIISMVIIDTFFNFENKTKIEK